MDTAKDVQTLLKRQEGGQNVMTSMLKEYGYCYSHPRTKELIISQTSSIIDQSRMPRVAHNNHMNQAVKSGYFSIDQHTKEIENNSVKFKKTSQWESVWFQKGQRRK